MKDKKRLNKSIMQICTSVLVILCMMSCASTKHEHYVVALSLDGFRNDYPQMANTPVLDSMARVGIHAPFRPCFPSVTFPNHYSMATGLYPDHNGLVNNFFYAPDLDSCYRMGLDDPRFFGGEPIWNTAEKQGVRSASFFWVGSDINIGGLPSNYKHFTKTIPFSNRADTVLAWLQLPAKTRPHLIMWYIEEPDAVGHLFKPESKQVKNMVESLDSLLGAFFNKARKLKTFKKTDFIVVSDHGMATYKKENFVNLADYLPRDSFNYVFDGVPTLLYPKSTYIETAYKILKTVPHITIYKKNEIPERLHYGTNARIGELVAVPDIGAFIRFRENDHKTFSGATHGYDNAAPEMQGIFYAAGPSFKHKENFPTMENVNLYLIIARLLNIKPAPNDGNVELVNELLKK